MKHALAVCAFVSVAAAATLDRDSLSGRLSAALEPHVLRGDVPAVVAMLVDSKTVLYGRAIGKRDVARGLALDTTSIFRIASMTKPITSLAIMMLADEGKIGVDDPASKYLPQAEKVRVATAFHDDGTYDSRAPLRPMTVRHLLTHTSGIVYGFVDPRVSKAEAAGQIGIDLPLVHDPGERFTYGSSTQVLGRIVEAVSGMPLDVFMQQRIFEPLGMHDTFYVVPAAKRDRVVTQHRKENDSFVETPNPETIRSPVRGDGGLFSTAPDYAVFVQLILNRGMHGRTRIVSERGVRLMLSNQIGSLRVQSQPASPPFPIGAGKDTFGFGFQIEGAPATRGLRSVGSGSWGGIFNTHFWIDPQRQRAGVVLMQFLPYYDSAALAVLRDFERAVYAE